MPRVTAVMWQLVEVVSSNAGKGRGEFDGQLLQEACEEVLGVRQPPELAALLPADAAVAVAATSSCTGAAASHVGFEQAVGPAVLPSLVVAGSELGLADGLSVDRAPASSLGVVALTALGEQALSMEGAALPDIPQLELQNLLAEASVWLQM